MGAFHAYDIRGIYGVDFDRETAYKVGYFIPSLLGTFKVLVGRDCRVSSEEVFDAVVKGITDAGADVYDIGLASTPMVYFGTANYGFEASVQITASHNPSEYNGMKISRRNALPVGLDSGLGLIKEWVDTNRETPAAPIRGKVIPMNIHDDYIHFFEKYRCDFSGLDIAFDLSNGMANLFAREVFGDFPIYINEGLDGRFPSHEPNPLLPSCQKMLIDTVKRNGSDIGVIFDGDADRVMFIDDCGEFISPDLVIALLGMYFIDEKGEAGTVLQDIRSSKSVGEFLVPKGAKMVTWRVGRAYAAPKLREIGGVWGGELAGHYYFRDFFYSDSGLLASMLVLRIALKLKKEGRKLSEVIAEIAHYRNSGEINFRIDDKSGAMDAVRNMWISCQEPTAVMDFDGYRIEFPDWWFNIRPSNTEPYLRFLCEASSMELLEEKISKTTELLEREFNAIRLKQ